jgi:hypothetical protein
VNVAGVYSNGFFATSGNISAANIVISGNLYLGGVSGTTGQYIRKSASGIGWVDSTFNGGTLTDSVQVNNRLYAQSFSTPNVQIGSNWGTTSNANVAVANISLVLNATTANVGFLVAPNFSSANIYQSAADTFVATNLSASNVYQTTGQSIQSPNIQIGTNWGTISRANLSVANVSAALNATNANITNLVVTNLSASNIAITAGSLQSSYINTGLGGNIATANLLITRSTGGTALQVNPLGGQVGVLLDNALVYTRISNMVSTNASITGTASSIGVRPGGVVDVVSNLYANTGRLEQLSVANLYIANNSKLQSGSNASIIISGNVQSANLVTGNIAANGNITTSAYLSTNTFVYTSAVTEPVAIHAGTAPAGEMNINLMANSIHYYTPSVTAVWTPNVRASAATPLNNMLSTGQSISFSMIVNQGVTPYNNNSGNLRIDNTWYTAKWPLAQLPTSTASRVEVYSYTLIKTGSGTWVVLGSLSSLG